MYKLKKEVSMLKNQQTSKQKPHTKTSLHSNPISTPADKRIDEIIVRFVKASSDIKKLKIREIVRKELGNDYPLISQEVENRLLLS